MEKTIKYLENGEYHYATVKDVGDLAKLKTDSKDDLVTAINDLFENGGKNAGKPEGYDKLVDQMADTIKKQQDISGKLNSAENDLKQKIADSNSSNRTITDELNAQIEAERQKVEALRLAAEQAQKELNEQVAKLNADSQELRKKTTDLANDVENKFGSVQNDYKTVSENLTNEAAALHKQLGDVKNEAEATKSRIQDQAEDIGNIHKTVDNVSNQVTQKIWMTDLDPVKQQVTQNSTEVQETQNQLKTKAEQSSLDLVANSVEKLDTEVKKNSEGLEVTVKKEEFAEDVAKLLKDKTNLLLGTRNFAGDKWSNLDHWHEEPGYWNGLKVYSSTSDWYGIQYQYEVKKGNQYTFSFYARQQSENNSAYIMLSEGSTGSQLACTEPYQKSDTHIGTEWKRYSLTFQAIADGIIYPRVEQSVTNNTIYVAGYKLELGKVATPWEPNEADVAENIERNESKFNVFSDKIEGVVKKQEQFSSSQTELETKVTQNAEGLKQASHQLEDANGKINKFQGDLESTAKGLKASYEEYTNKAIGQISDSSLNLIRNGSFSNKDSDFDQWQNVSAKANIREDENGLRWVELTQSGMTTDNPQGITSNYFIVKQGKVTVAVDIKLGDKANLDNQNILLLELYNDAKQRVDFADVSLEQLGLSMDIVSDHSVHRGLFRLGIDRKDVKYMTVKAILHRNGDVWLTNFSAKLSSIDDGGYTPNPDDVNQQILKMNTKIEEDAEHIALKANSVDVTRDIKSAVDGIQIGGRNLANGTDKEYTMVYGIPNTTWQNGYAYESLPTKILTSEILPQNDQFHANLVPGREYTQTIWFETDADVKKLNATITWFTNVGHDEQPAKIIKVGENSYKLFSTYTWPGKTDNNVRLFDILYLQDAFDLSTGTYIKFGKLKLEEGNVSTDWTPSLQDTSEEIKSAKDAAIQVASDQINLHVNELSTSFDEKLNKRVNEVKTASEKFTSDGIEQVVTKITNVKNDVDRLGDTVDGIQVGGRNYLQNSDKSITGWAQDLGTIPNATLNELAGKTITVSADVEWNNFKSDSALQNRLGFELTVSGSDGKGYWLGAWKYPNTSSGKERISTQYTLPAGVTFTVNNNGQNGYVSINGSGKVSHVKIEIGNRMTDWTPAPEDINQTIKDAAEYKTVIGTIDFNNLKTQQKIFYKDLQATNAPAGGNYWYYLDVEPGYDGRILQTAISDRDNITWVRTFADSWTPWIRQADKRNVDYLNDQINSFKNETTAKITNLGDRVTTEVNSVTTKINDSHTNDVELIRNNNFPDGNKGSWNGNLTTVINGNNIPAELGQDGMKVLRVIQRDTYEDDIWYSVKPGEIFDVDYWIWPTGSYDSQLGLWFVDKDKGNSTWRGVVAKKGTGWIHYTGTIEAPSNAAFAKPWIQINKDASETGSAAWIAKPSIRRHDTFAEKKISEINTKLEVANGKIEGKVTETQVQDLLNRGHYATQEWSQGQINLTKDQFNVDIKKVTSDLNSRVNEVKTASEKFTSDGIEQTVRKITDVKNQVDNIRIGGRNLIKGTDKDFVVSLSDLHDPGSSADYIYWPVAQLIAGKTYTFSADMRGVNTTKASLRIFDLSPNSFAAMPGNSELDLDIDGSRKSWTFTVANDGHEYSLLLYAGQSSMSQANNKVIYHHAKLEFGNMNTDWTPAPEDTSAEIKSAKDAAIQVASDQINIKTNELTTKYNESLNQRINESKSASEKFTSDQIVQTVKKITDVQGNVDKLEQLVKSNNGGGINLLKGTANFRPDDIWFPLGAWIRTSEKYNGLTVFKVHVDENWNGLTQYYPVKAGETYTFSLNARYESGNGKSSFYIELNDPQQEAGHNHAHVSPSSQSVLLTEDWNRYSITFTVNSDGYIKPRIERDNFNKNILEICGFKLEKGSVATPWTPAPEDAESTHTLETANIDDMKSQGHYFVHNLAGNPIGGWVYVDVIGDGTSRVRQDVYQDSGTKHMYRRLFGSSWSDWEQGAYISDVNSLKTEVTASVKNLGDRVTTEVNSITSRVNSNNGGGINLLRGTGSEWKTLTGSVWFCQTTGAGAVELGSFTTGDTVTYSITVRNNSQYAVRPEIVGFSDDNGTRSFNISGTESVQPGETKTVSVSATVAENTVKIIGWLISSGSEPTFSVDAKNEKLERGSIATPWSPAPEDTAEAINSLNTKWDVANGQIQGKVTATDVNNILNGKGYATQSWAQTMFTMKSDAITLQAVRDNITNGIQNQVNDTRNILNNLQVGGRNYLQESDKLITGWAQDLGTLPNEVLNSLAGKTITVSVDVEWSNFKSDGSKQNRLGFELSVSGSDGHSYWLGAWKNPTTASGKERVSTQYSLPAGVTFTVNNNGANGYVSISGTGKVSHAKIEVGNKQTDWSPAPQDSKSYTDQQITNTNKKIDTQTLDSANIDQMKTQGHYFVKNLTGNPIPGWVYVDVTGNGNNRIKQDVYQDNGYEHKSRRWFGSYWTEWTTDVNNKNVVSQINITPDQVKIASNKIEIDGNTYIHGTLNVPEVKLQGKKGLVNLAGDSGLELLSNDGNKVEVGSSGIKLSSGMTKGLNSYIKESGFSLNVDSRGMRLTNTLTIQGRTNGTSDYNFLKLEPGVLSGSNNQIPSGTIAYVPNNYSRELGPASPGGFFALGREDVDTNGDLIQRRSEVAYVTKSTDGWDQGFTIKAPFFIQPPDANHGIRATWVSWSQWDLGERYPALVNNTTNWGGICFPSSGRVTLFDSKGKYYTPDKDTGIGPYDDYMGKNNR